MKNTLTLLLAALVLSGCTVVSANRVFPKVAWYWSADARMQREENAAEKAARAKYQAELTALAVKIQKRDGTNFVGVYQGMIAEHDGASNVMMFSATSGEWLKALSYQDFKEIFILKTKPEYGVPGPTMTNRLEIPK